MQQRGDAEIAASCKQNDPAIASRAYKLVQIYAANSPATDMLVLGQFLIVLKDENRVCLDFTARFIVAPETDSGRKFSSVQVWTDPTEFIAALAKANETLKMET